MEHFNVDEHGWLLDLKEMEDDDEEEVASAAAAEEEQVQELVGGEGGAAVDAGGAGAALTIAMARRCEKLASLKSQL